MLEFSSDHRSAVDLSVTLVVTMSDGRITAMRDYRRRSKALRVARVPAVS